MVLFVQRRQPSVFLLQWLHVVLSFMPIFFFRVLLLAAKNNCDPKMHCVAICIASSCDLCLRRTRTTECALEKCTYRLCGRCAFLYYQTSVHKVCPACRRPDAFVVSKNCSSRIVSCRCHLCHSIKPYLIVACQGCCCVVVLCAGIMFASVVGNLISCMFGFLCFGADFFGHGLLVFVVTFMILLVLFGYCFGGSEEG